MPLLLRLNCKNDLFLENGQAYVSEDILFDAFLKSFLLTFYFETRM